MHARKKINFSSSEGRTTKPYNFTEQHHNVGKIPPLEIHIVDPEERLEETFTWAHDPEVREHKQAPYARTRQVCCHYFDAV
jgi:hypothetical protein